MKCDVIDGLAFWRDWDLANIFYFLEGEIFG